jgi:hypothetical protein
MLAHQPAISKIDEFPDNHLQADARQTLPRRTCGRAGGGIGPRACAGNYMAVSMENPRGYWEAAVCCACREASIWSFPEPPILFLLVGSEEMPKRQGNHF